MRHEPVSDDLHDPLVSVLVYDYDPRYLDRCLDSLFSQAVLDNLEVVFLDDGTNDGGLEIGLEYAKKYPSRMTVRCNGRPSRSNPLEDARRLAKGVYVVTLRQDEAFQPGYVRDCVAAMESDPLARFATVHRRLRGRALPPNIDGLPPVDILIHNYNYGRYLRECLDSVFAQTYPNIRVIFSDNASTDDSWEIATEFARRRRGAMTLIRNRKNFGPAANCGNCHACIEGKYFCILCSDDALKPDFVTTCVEVLEAHRDAAFVMAHRAIVDQDGTATEEPPFYNRSCIIPGPEQAAVYMMAAVNPTISQVMYSTEKAIQDSQTGGLVSRWFGQRLADFELCCAYSMAYIREPLVIHRVHAASDSSQVCSSLMEAFGQFVLPHQFVEMAVAKENLQKAVGRLPQAIEKLGHLCLRYAVRALAAGQEETGRRYYHLSAAVSPKVGEDAVFDELTAYWSASARRRSEILAKLVGTDNLIARTVSYDPPPGSVSILADADPDAALVPKRLEENAQ
jgi:glycosyltransferase involved in cell wall biosynthesis